MYIEIIKIKNDNKHSNHSVLRMGATLKELFITKLSNFKKISIKQAIFIIKIVSIYVKGHKLQKK